MPKFLAVTSRGLRDLLQEELVELGFSGARPNGSTVEFSCNWEGCYKANQLLRTATRVLYPVLDFPAYQPEDLYHNILKHDFTQYIDTFQTLMVESSVESSSFRDKRFVALKVKDAIVDQFRDKLGSRPSIDKANPHLRVFVRVVKNQVSVAIDTSGGSLSSRGYREEQGGAPLREHLAAGLIRATGWKGDVPLIDPMCGSGTFLIEAERMRRGTPSANLKKSFAFCHFKKFRDRLWSVEPPPSVEAEVPLLGFDRNPLMISIARKNAERAGCEGGLSFAVKNALQLQPLSVPPGILIVNPPYGERMGEVEALKEFFYQWGAALKTNFKGWTLWVLSGNEELTRQLNMKSAKKISVSNGSIDCKFLRYDIKS